MLHVSHEEGRSLRGRLRERARALRGVRVDERLIPLGLTLAAALVYLVSNPYRPSIFDHFVWQAEAFLDGRHTIRWPVEGEGGNAYLHDLMPILGQPGYGVIPFPPLPAIVLLPLVAIFGVDADQSIVASLIGGVNVGLAWLLVRQLTEDRRVALLATLFFGFGTVHWYSAMIGSTWYYAHVLAVTFLLLSLSVAARAGRQATAGTPESAPAGVRRLFDGRQFLAGLLLGVAALARLPVIFGAPFLLFVGGGRSVVARGLSAALGASIPIALLLGYNLLTTGSFLHPAYEYLYRVEYTPRPELIHHEWLIQDPRYVPQNIVIMLAWPPEVLPEGADCGLALLDPACPLVRPDPLGMSLLLASPAYLLIVPALLVGWRRKLVQGAALAVLGIAFFNLMHFSQGWVQFGYRFSNDFAPFALILVTLGIARVRQRWLSVALVGASMLINAWGVYWGIKLLW